MTAHQVPARAAQIGERLVRALQERLHDHPYVEQIRGKGLIIGIVCKGPAADLIAAAHEQRLLVVPAGPNVVRLLPNLLVSEQEAERAVDVLTQVFSSQLSKEEADERNH